MKKIMLDAGHGLKTPGKQTPNGEKEFTLNQAVVNYITKNLEAYDVEIAYSNDTTGAVDIPLETRVKRTNAYNPDVFISIHHNAYNEKWGSHTGVEVYYHTRGTAADKKLAQLVGPKLAAETKLKDRGVKNAEFVVLTCKVTAILCEGGFMDSTIDYPVITSTAGQKLYAKAVSDALIEFLKLKKVQKEEVADPTLYYRLIVGSYQEKANAEAQQKKLKAAGFDAFLLAFKKDKETYYRVVAGSYQVKKNAESHQKELDKKGFSSFLVAEHIPAK